MLDIIADGKEYISASRASEKVGYSNDYIGQLCRAKKIPGKLLGRTWYIDFNSLVEYKNNKKTGKATPTEQENPIALPGLDFLEPQGPTLSIDSQGRTLKPTAPAQEPFLRKIVSETETFYLLPPLSKKNKYVPPVFTARLVREASIVTLSLIMMISVGFGVVEKNNPYLVQAVQENLENISQDSQKLFASLPFESVRHSVSNTLAFARSFGGSQQLAAVSFFDSFQNLKNLALKKFFFATTQTKQTSPPPLLGKERETVPPQGPTLSIDSQGRTLKPEQSALTQSTPVLNLNSLRSDLRTELQSFILANIPKVTSPLNVPQNGTSGELAQQVLATALRQEILLADTRPAVQYSVTRQSSSDTSHFSSALTSSLNSLTTGGTFTDSTLTGATVSGPTGSFTNFSFSLATGTSATTTSFFSTTASSTNLYSSLATFGTLTVSGATTLGGSLSVSGNTTTIGQLLSTRIPTLAHVFSPWPSGTSNASDATIYINPASAAADTNIFAAAVNGSVKFLVDAEGDIYGNNLVLTGSTSQGETTIAGNLSIQDNTILGDASSDTATFNAQLLAKASTTLQNFTFVNATGTSATTTNLFSTTASSTNLFSSALTVNGKLFTVNGAPTLNDWFDQSVKTTASPSFANITATTLGTFANVLATASTTLQNFTFVNATGTSATTTNFFSTTASSTNLFTTNLFANTANLTESGNLFYLDSRVNSYIHASTTIAKLYTSNTFTGANIFDNITRSTTTSATTTNFFATTASSTNLFAQTGTIGTLTASSLCLSSTCNTAWPSTFDFTAQTYGVSTSTTLGLLNGFLSTASSTLTNFTFSTATGTSATTTSFFSTTASSTNLFSSALTVNGNLFTVSGAPTLDNWFDQSVKVASAPTFAGATLSSDLVFSSDYAIRRNTSDGSDSGSFSLSGGGDVGNTRGAYIQLYGNERNGQNGNILVGLGNVTGSYLAVYNKNNTNVFNLSGDDGSATFTSSLQGEPFRFIATNTTDNSSTVVMKISTGVANATTNMTFIHFATDNNTHTAGTIKLNNNAVAYNTTSDQRLKENIQPTALGLDTLSQIQVRDFNFIADAQKKQRQGFIAQELYTIYPEAVSMGGDDPATNPWGVDYGRLTPLIIKSIQDLNLNLETIAGTASSTTPESESFVSSFFTNLFSKITTWLADAGNGIGDLFANKVFTKEVETELLCVKNSGGKTCITRDQLDSLLAGAGGSSPSSDSGSSSGGSSTPDTTPPVITLTGSSIIELTVGDTYTEQGATASDDVDGTVSVITTGSVDTATVGTYILHYNATDTAGNPAVEVTRTVNVNAPVEPPPQPSP